MNRGRSESMGMDYEVVESIRRKAALQTAHSQSPPSRHQLQLQQMPQLMSPHTNSPRARVGRIRSNSSPIQSPLDSPAARKAIDELRGAPKFVEMHRSSSGRNLRFVPRLKSDEVATQALTPTRPTRRTASGSGRSSDSVFRFEDFAPRSPAMSRAVSLEEKHCEYEQHPSPQQQQQKPIITHKHDRRGSFSISKLALQMLETRSARSDSSAPEHDLEPIDDDTNQVDDNNSEDEDDEEEATEYMEEPAEEQRRDAPKEKPEEKAVYCFDLWKKAGRNRSLPGAIASSGGEDNNEQKEDEAEEENQQQHLYYEEEKRSIEQIDYYTKPSKSEAEILLSKWAFEDKALPSSPQSAPLPISMIKGPEPLSLTRSVSPRIGSSSTRSSRRSLSTDTHTTTITKWKRGELIGEGTFGKV